MPAHRKEYPEAIKMYEAGLSLEDIADFYLVSRQSMHKWFARRGVPMRSNLRFAEDNVFHRGGITQDERATSIYRTALQRGKITNPKICSECLSENYVSGHHDDYNRPLDVRWLCHACHYLWHTKNTAKPAINLPPKMTQLEICSLGGRSPRTKKHVKTKSIL